MSKDPGPSVFESLSPREREVLQLIAEGHSTKEIARTLKVSVKTVETHRRQLMNKLELFSVAEKKFRIYKKKLVETPADLHFSTPFNRTSTVRLPRSGEEFRAGNFQLEANQLILEHFAPPGVIVMLYNHPLTSIGLEKFLKDWEKAQAVKA